MASAGAICNFLSLQEIIDLVPGKSVPDHSSLCCICQHLPLRVRQELLIFVFRLLEKTSLLAGECLGIDTWAIETKQP